VLEDNARMIEHAVSFYKQLFGKENMTNIRFGGDFWGGEEKNSKEENQLLVAEFNEDEILQAINESYAEGASGPDGFSFLFYQKFWPIIKMGLMDVVKKFERAEINIARLNYAMIILIPKEEEARSLKKFRPISLINCSFKIFAKTLNNRLEKICDKLLAANQTAFIKSRYILESVVATHEIIHEVVKHKEKGVILKLDYEKAYDRVSW
jgi:hypothetical protein